MWLQVDENDNQVKATYTISRLTTEEQLFIVEKYIETKIFETFFFIIVTAQRYFGSGFNRESP